MPFFGYMLPNYFLKDIEGKYYEIIYIDKEIQANLFYNYLIGKWQMENGRNFKKEKKSAHYTWKTQKAHLINM